MDRSMQEPFSDDTRSEDHYVQDEGFEFNIWLEGVKAKISSLQKHELVYCHEKISKKLEGYVSDEVLKRKLKAGKAQLERQLRSKSRKSRKNPEPYGKNDGKDCFDVIFEDLFENNAKPRAESFGSEEHERNLDCNLSTDISENSTTTNDSVSPHVQDPQLNEDSEDSETGVAKVLNKPISKKKKENRSKPQPDSFIKPFRRFIVKTLKQKHERQTLIDLELGLTNSIFDILINRYKNVSSFCKLRELYLDNGNDVGIEDLGFKALAIANRLLLNRKILFFATLSTKTSKETRVDISENYASYVASFLIGDRVD